MPLEQVTIPFAERSPSFIRTLQESEQCFLGRGLAAQIIVEINEFTQVFVVAGLGRLDGCGFKALGRRGGVAVEGGLAEAPIARPEACTDHLVRGSFPRKNGRG
jgi:TolB-like protein